MDLRGKLLQKITCGNRELDAEPKRQKMGGEESTKKGSGEGDSSNVYNFYNCSNLTFN